MALDVPERICGVLNVSIMGLTRCYKTAVFTFISYWGKNNLLYWFFLYCINIFIYYRNFLLYPQDMLHQTVRYVSKLVSK